MCKIIIIRDDKTIYKTVMKRTKIKFIYLLFKKNLLFSGLNFLYSIEKCKVRVQIITPKGRTIIIYRFIIRIKDIVEACVHYANSF